jgi:hypothetical protein
MVECELCSAGEARLWGEGLGGGAVQAESFASSGTA